MTGDADRCLNVWTVGQVAMGSHRPAVLQHIACGVCRGYGLPMSSERTPERSTRPARLRGFGDRIACVSGCPFGRESLMSAGP
jgi:hypothetical protein